MNGGVGWHTHVPYGHVPRSYVSVNEGNHMEKMESIAENWR